jgi:hypothetical protein
VTNGTAGSVKIFIRFGRCQNSNPGVTSLIKIALTQNIPRAVSGPAAKKTSLEIDPGGFRFREASISQAQLNEIDCITLYISVIPKAQPLRSNSQKMIYRAHMLIELARLLVKRSDISKRRSAKPFEASSLEFD